MGRMTDRDRRDASYEKATAVEMLRRQNTPEARFMLRGLALQAARGGAPKASYENGQYVFTYPDGTVTIGGVIVKEGGK